MDPDSAFPPTEPDFSGLARDLLDEGAGEGGEGQDFGDYRLEEEIARGGMGIVYRAWHVPLARTVAVKVMREGAFAEGREAERFRQEAGAAAALRHPGIVAVHETGVRQGRPFYAMEWIDGPNLAQAVAGNLPTSRQAAQWVKEVAEAMAHAHAQGVIHRDLKPANVLLDAAGKARVTDFGMASRADTAAGLTLSGQMLGTPGYMAPEVARGASRSAGPAADVYGLGALLFHLLTGRAPFIGESQATILRQVAEEEAPRPRTLVADVPRDLDGVCRKALAREPRDRYASAAAMAEDLGRFLEGQPVVARSLPLAVRWWRKARRHPVAVIAAVITAALGAGSVWLLGHPPGAQKAAEKPITPDFDFSAASGGLRRCVIPRDRPFHEETEGAVTLRSQFLAAPHLRDGLFVLTEDATVPSPAGGSPGVLHFRIGKLPAAEGNESRSPDYWNFRLFPAPLTSWTGEKVTMDDLHRARLRFRWKLTAGRTMDVRFEPLLPNHGDGWPLRCDMGSLVGNGQWQLFDRKLSSGSNLGPFATATIDDARSGYLVFANHGGVGEYGSGDTLLLDDLSFGTE